MDFLRAGHQKLHRVEVIGCRLAGIAIEEGVGADHHGAVAVIHHSGDDSIVQGRWIQEGVQTANQGQQGAGGQAEAVEEGECVEEPFLIGNVEKGVHLADVGQEIGVGEYHSLRNALRSGSEENHGRCFGRIESQSRHLQTSATAQAVLDERQDFGHGSDAHPDVFEVVEPDAGRFEGGDIQLGLLEEGPGGDDVADSGQLGALQENGRTRGEVEDRRGISGGPQCHQGDGHAVDIGQEYADLGGVALRRSRCWG